MDFKRLPHIDTFFDYQFITFRTQDSIDDFLLRLFAQEIENDKKQLAIDQYVDLSIKGAYLKDEALIMMYDFLKAKTPELYDLISFCIMPNHVHILIKPNMPLPKVMQRIKGGSSRALNRLLNRKGAFWAKNYYDKGIRDHRHFNCVYQYIKNNPLKLDDFDKRFYGIYAE